MTDQGNNNQNISCNPFAALFSSLADAKQFASGQQPPLSAAPPCECSSTFSIELWFSRISSLANTLIVNLINCIHSIA